MGGANENVRLAPSVTAAALRHWESLLAHYQIGTSWCARNVKLMHITSQIQHTHTQKKGEILSSCCCHWWSLVGLSNAIETDRIKWRT